MAQRLPFVPESHLFSFHMRRDHEISQTGFLEKESLHHALPFGVLADW